MHIPQGEKDKQKFMKKSSDKLDARAYAGLPLKVQFSQFQESLLAAAHDPSCNGPAVSATAGR